MEAHGERRATRTEDKATDIVPKPTWKRRPVIPKEDSQTGTNRPCICVQQAGPAMDAAAQVTPIQIVQARKIGKFFTGLPGRAGHQLPRPSPATRPTTCRPRSARISAATHISPLNF